MMWQPNADGLAQLVEVLRNANSPNTQVQLEVHQVRARAPMH